MELAGDLTLDIETRMGAAPRTEKVPPITSHRASPFFHFNSCEQLITMTTEPLKVPTCLVKLKPGEHEDPLELELQYTSENVDEYDACAWFSEDDGPPLGCAQDEMPKSLQEMLQSVRSSTDVRLLWIEQLCAYPDSDEMPTSQALMVKSAYEEAQTVVVWAGLYSDPCDAAFDVYLQPGNEESTRHAFEFAQDLALAPTTEVLSVLERRYEPTNVHSWAYLYRILCRPFFRGMTLLRTNYTSELISVNVQCAEAMISLQLLQTAAERLFGICPMPEFICETNLTEDNMAEVLGADRQFLLSGIRFGFKSADILVRMKYLLMNRPVQMLESTRLSHEERFMMHLGFCEDLYDVKNEKQNIQDAAVGCQQLVADPASYIDRVLERSSALLQPTLPFEGKNLPRIDATLQAPFVHPHVNRTSSIGLIVVLPSESLSAPLRCGFIDAPMTSYPKFSFVTNNTFIRRALPPEILHGAEFAMTTRPRASILVNEQAFVIPQVQEVFLRLIRQPEDAIHVFLWNLCMYPEEAVLQTRSDVERYLEVKAFMKTRGKADELDMFAYLAKAGKERSDEDLESVGLPATMSWDDWISQLNDST